jgi:4-amino-4-deoxy-L-arabinose transferase-like glycosyltransferase
MASLTRAQAPAGLGRPPWTQAERLGLALILAVGGLLRMGWPGLTEFKQDEAQLYQLALNLAELKAFPLHGINSSLGLPNAPASVYLFALPLVLWHSPLAATLFVGLLNTASVALAYLLARRYWGRRTALAGALLYACAPWAVIYSRKIWAQDTLPLFVLAYIFAGLLAFVEGRRRWVAAHLFLLFVIIEIHLSGLALAPLTLLLLVVYWRGVDWRYAALGVAAGLLTLLPPLIFAATQPAVAAAGTSIVQQLLARPAVISLDSLTLPIMLVLGTDVHSLAGPSAFRAFDASLPNFNWLLALGGLAALAGLGLALWRWWVGRGAPRPAGVQAAAIVAAWLLMPALYFLRHSTDVFPHYFIILFPAPFLLAGLAFDALLDRWRWLWLVPLALAAGQVWLVLALLNFLASTATPGGFGTPLGLLMRTAQAARAAGQPEVLVVSEGAQPGLDLAPSVFDVLLGATPHRFVDGRTTAVFPAGPATVLLWPAQVDYGWPVAALYRAWGGGDWGQIIPLRQGEGQALIAVSPGAQPVVPRPLAAPALLANGVVLLGSGRAAGGWQLWWQAPGPLPGDHYQVFAHLLDAAGQRLAQVNGPTYPPDAWRAGDLVANRFALPEGGSVVQAGMYAYPSLQPVEVLDAADNPAGQWLTFPP